MGLDTAAVEKIYRLLALAPLSERFVLPTAPAGKDGTFVRQGACGFGDAL